MQKIFEEYGKTMVAVVIAIVILGVLFGGFTLFWRDSSDIEGGLTTAQINYIALQEEQPILNVKDIQAKMGENVNIFAGVSAHDNVDGNLTNKITVHEISGERLKKIADGSYKLNTTKRGCSYLEYRVKNTKGLQTKQKVIAFID